ncbi:MAG: hypothetical protein KDD32_07870 [Bacteroidetes bacterium]|nr:hypothetical protein [Bacteroidota bacterium]
MKAVFIFILGMLIAIFLLLPNNGNSSTSKDVYKDPLEIGQTTYKKDLTQFDKMIISMAKSLINTDQMDSDFEFTSEARSTHHSTY